MSNVQDRPKLVRVAQDPYPQYNTPLMVKNDPVASTSNDVGRSPVANPPPSSTGNDDEAQVNSDLLNAWMQRLQTLTIVTAFLTSIDGELFSLTALNTQIGIAMSANSRELVYSCLSGALIFHICASILGYIASFALVRYRIVNASDNDPTKVGGILLFGLGATQPAQRLSRKIVLEPVRPLNWLMAFLQRPERLRLFSIRSSRLSPPLTLITRCYYTTLCLSVVGFVLALAGILSYIWAGLRMPVGVFSTVSLVAAISAGVWAIAM